MQEAQMYLRNTDIIVDIDDQSGATLGIYKSDDEKKMNWILEDAAWGDVSEFCVESVERKSDFVTVISNNKTIGLKITVKKEITADGYFEKYSIENVGKTEFFLTKENFAIPFSYDCLYDPKKDIRNDCCINHVWCGGDRAWISSVKCIGKAPYLMMDVTEGAIDDYSLFLDTTRVENGSYYRGTLLLHPRECIISPKEALKITFRHRFTDKKPNESELDYEGAIRFIADKYSVQENEKIALSVESARDFKDLKILCDGEEIQYEREGNRAIASASFDSAGERKITAEIDGKLTFIYVNCISNVSKILEKRANFIAKNQQYIKNGSHLDGAYLVYDNDTKRQFYDGSFLDHNACRERIGMGVLVCLALQQRYDESLMQSLKKHRAFVEREIFDAESGYVYNHVGRDATYTRFFNFPWLSTYYMEWYRLTGERQCIENAAKILIRFFELTDSGEDAQCMEVSEICEYLRKENMLELENKLSRLFLKYADSLVSSFKTAESRGETSYVNEIPNERCAYLSQAYKMTGDERYLRRAKEYFEMSRAFFSEQPDFHLNCVTVRYWDRYWFGKIKSYGDIFPHYWSALTGWGLNAYNEFEKSEQIERIIVSNLTGNLCVYAENGAASNNYLYPYKVIQYLPENKPVTSGIEPGIYYGKNYDSWANDQDWALYYAAKILKNLKSYATK